MARRKEAHGKDRAPNESDAKSRELEETRAAHIDELIERIKRSADKLKDDGSSRGDLKILSRAIAELRYAFKVFSPYRNQRKVTIFGSARTPAGEPAYEQAVRLGAAMAELDWLVVTGAGCGIMEAGHRGAGRKNAMGLNIMLPFEQSANPVILGDPKLVNMKYFFTRKLMFVKECDAVVCLPGGFGTLDEGLEVLTLLQTGKRDIVPLVFLDEPGGDYWSKFNGYIVQELLSRELISEEDLNLYLITDSCDKAVEEIANFYRVYHSMRFVRQDLVFRLREAPADDLLQAINHYFQDILSKGVFEIRAALPEERDEYEIVDLPRLVFRFNRRNLGRLRLLINTLNRGEVLPAEHTV